MTFSRLISTQPKTRWVMTALLALAVTLGSAQVFADEYRHRGMGHSRVSLDYIASQLDMTEEQQAEVQDILKTVMQERRNEWREAQRDLPRSERGRPDAETMAAHREAIRTTLADELGPVLQPNQIEGLLTYLEAHIGRR